MVPILRALAVGLMISVPILIEGNRGSSLNLEWRMTSSVLSLFSSSLLVVIRLVISTRQLSIREIVVVRSTLSSQMKVCTVECHQHIDGIYHRIRSPSGAVYKRYSNEANTDPWGSAGVHQILGDELKK